MKAILSTSKDFAKYSVKLVKEHLDPLGFRLVKLDGTRKLSETEFINAIDGYEAVITYSGFDIFSRRVIESSPRLRVISRHGTGHESIDLKTAKERGVYVCTTHEGAHEDRAVADLTIAFILALARRLVQHNETTKSGGWERPLAFDLWGKTLGIIGLGKIGKAVAVRAKGFGLKLKAFDERPDKEFAKRHNIQYTSLKVLLETSDYITIHMPLTEKTTNMIGSEEISTMKRGVFLVNCARAPIVDNEALFEGLKSKHIAGAGIDVYHNEPPLNDPLLSLDNVIATPHVAAYTIDTIQAMDMLTLKACTDVLLGKRPKNIINGL